MEPSPGKGENPKVGALGEHTPRATATVPLTPPGALRAPPDSPLAPQPRKATVPFRANFKPHLLSDRSLFPSAAPGFLLEAVEVEKSKNEAGALWPSSAL